MENISTVETQGWPIVIGLIAVAAAITLYWCLINQLAKKYDEKHPDEPRKKKRKGSQYYSMSAGQDKYGSIAFYTSPIVGIIVYYIVMNLLT